MGHNVALAVGEGSWEYRSPLPFPNFTSTFVVDTIKLHSSATVRPVQWKKIILYRLLSGIGKSTLDSCFVNSQLSLKKKNNTMTPDYVCMVDITMRGVAPSMWSEN